VTTKATIENPSEVEVTLAITLTLGQWRLLSEQLSASPKWNSYPSHKLLEELRGLAKSVDKAIPLLKETGESE